MSMEVQSNMHDSGTRKKRKAHILANSAIDAGLEALKALAEAPAPAVKMTARAAIMAWLPQIINEQARGTSLLRIYNDLKKATKLRISYRSFQNYVSTAAKDAGLRPAKTKAEAAPPARPMPEREPALTSKDGWNCGKCETDAVPSKEKDGRTYWACPHCLTVYESGPDEKISQNRLP